MKKFILNLLSDIKNIKFFFTINTKDKICFFNLKNENTFQYLEYYINNKNKKKLSFFH